MPANKKIAIFDFDGTIYKYQSPDEYADFVARNNIRTRFLQFVCFVLDRRFKQYWVKHKKLKLSKIKGIHLSELQRKAIEFIDKFIKGNIIDIVDQELERYINDPEFDVVIVSAGYDIYLRYFCDARNIKHLLATEIELQDSIATGKWVNADCFGQNKVLRLKKMFNLDEYDLPNSVCFSDSMSDKPIFDLVGNKFFVKIVGEEYVIKNI